MAEFYSARGWEIPPLPWTNLSPPFSIPHLDRLMSSDARAALNGADIVVIGHSGREEIDAIRESATAQFILDLVGVKELSGLPGVIYEGICW